MAPGLNRIFSFRRRRHGDAPMRRGPLALSAFGLMVVVVGCAQATVALTAGDAISAIGIARTAFGHPTSHLGAGQLSATPGSTSGPALFGSAGNPLGVTGPDPTPWSTRTPGATPTPNPTSTPNPTYPTPTPTPTPTPPPSSAPHVLIVLEENKGYAAVMSGAPYLDGLAKAYLNSSSWFGVDHPSAPNYVALLSGSTQTVVGDCTPPNCGPYNVTSLPGQLAAAGIPWTAYMESMPTPCYAGSTFGLYAEKHDPFMYFDDVLKNNCAKSRAPLPRQQFARGKAGWTQRP